MYVPAKQREQALHDDGHPKRCLRISESRCRMTTATEETILVLDGLDQPIRGAKKIRAARGSRETLSQTFRGLEAGHIPARKRGRLWETTLRLLMNGGPTPAPRLIVGADRHRARRQRVRRGMSAPRQWRGHRRW
jgi:hypothetical protein